MTKKRTTKTKKYIARLGGEVRMIFPTGQLPSGKYLEIKPGERVEVSAADAVELDKYQLIEIVTVEE